MDYLDVPNMRKVGNCRYRFSRAAGAVNSFLVGLPRKSPTGDSAMVGSGDMGRFTCYLDVRSSICSSNM